MCAAVIAAAIAGSSVSGCTYFKPSPRHANLDTEYDGKIVMDLAPFIFSKGESRTSVKNNLKQADLGLIMTSPNVSLPELYSSRGEPDVVGPSTISLSGKGSFSTMGNAISGTLSSELIRSLNEQGVGLVPPTVIQRYLQIYQGERNKRIADQNKDKKEKDKVVEPDGMASLSWVELMMSLYYEMNKFDPRLAATMPDSLLVVNALGITWVKQEVVIQRSSSHPSGYVVLPKTYEEQPSFCKEKLEFYQPTFMFSADLLSLKSGERLARVYETMPPEEAMVPALNQFMLVDLVPVTQERMKYRINGRGVTKPRQWTQVIGFEPQSDDVCQQAKAFFDEVYPQIDQNMRKSDIPKDLIARGLKDLFAP